MVKIALLREHKAKCTRLRWLEAMIGEGSFRFFRHLLLAEPGQRPLRLLKELRYLGARRGRIVTIRPALFRIPKLGIGKWCRPRTFDEAHEAVRSFHCRFEAVGSKHEHLGVRRDRWRSGAPRQGNFRLTIGHKVWSDWAPRWQSFAGGGSRHKWQRRSGEEQHERSTEWGNQHDPVPPFSATCLATREPEAL